MRAEIKTTREADVHEAGRSRVPDTLTGDDLRDAVLEALWDGNEGRPDRRRARERTQSAEHQHQRPRRKGLLADSREPDHRKPPARRGCDSRSRALPSECVEYSCAAVGGTGGGAV